MTKTTTAPATTDLPGPRACSVEGCASARQARGLCWQHFGRWRRLGDPLASGQHGGRRDRQIGPAENVPDPAPLRALRAQLELDRAAEFSFEFAWSHAIAAALRPLPKHLSAEWREVLVSTRDFWRRAYLRLPEPDAPSLGVLTIDEDAEPWVVHRRSGPPVETTGQRHDGASQLEPVIVPWCA